MNENAQYTDATRASLQRIFGTGFTSPGGVNYMDLLLDGLDVSGHVVMDLGCGVGGDSLLLGNEFGARRVYSVDVDPGNLTATRVAVEKSGLGGTIIPTLVEPGPLPFDECFFDTAHTKAMLCHIPIDGLTDLFSEVFRVLRAGGTFVVADWMMDDKETLSPSYHDFVDDLENAGLTFFFKTLNVHTDALKIAGFTSIECRNVTPRIHTYAKEILDQVLGPAREDLISAMGEEGYSGMVTRSHGRVEALGRGDLQFQYLKAIRPY